MALCGLLEHTGWARDPSPITIAFDGGVYEQFPEYRRMLRSALKEQLGGGRAGAVCQRERMAVFDMYLYFLPSSLVL